MTTYNSFWFQSVLDSFLADCNGYVCICPMSPAFECAWSSIEFRYKLREFAQEWIKESNNIVAKVCPDYFESLFFVDNDYTYPKWRDVMRQIRIDFLKWCIEKVEISI